MKQKLKRFMAGFMAMLTLVGTLFTNGTTAFAASPQANIAFWNASVKNSGEVSELKPGYNHGKILYAILDGNSAYCMNFGLRADGGQLMNSYDDASTSMSAQQRKLLSYCLYYGFNSTQKAAPSNSQCDEYIATQAMVWVIVADIFGTGSGDSAARKLCNTAPSPDSSYSYYERLSFDFDIKKAKKVGADFRNDLCNGMVKYFPDHFEDESKFCKALFIKKYPSSLSDRFINEITSLPVHSITSIDVVPVPKDLTTKVLQKKYLGIESDIIKQQRVRNKNNDFSTEISYAKRTEKKEIEEIMDDVRENDQCLFFVGVTIILMAESKKELESVCETVETIGKRNSCTIDTHYLKQREALNTALPIGVRQVETMRTLLTQSLAVLMPFNVQELNDSTGNYYGINQISKNVNIGNRKKLINGNGFVFGVPGSGKSFFCKMEMGSVFLSGDDEIIVIDPMNEYFDIAETYGGTVVNMSTYTDNYVNPLEMDVWSLDPNDSKGMVREKGEFMLGLCEQCIGDSLNSRQKSIIDRCVRKLYIDIARSKEKYIPVMSDFYDILMAQPEDEAKDIALSLELFVNGSLNIFNHQTNVDVDNRFTVYGIRDLGTELSPITMLVMMESIQNRIVENGKRGKATWLYIDEFHVLLNSEYSAKYLQQLWKKVRKQGGLCTGITQNVVDLLQNYTATTMLANSEFVALLKQANTDSSKMAEVIGVSEAQLRFVTNTASGMGLIKCGSVVIPFDNQISKDTDLYRLYNTNIHEKIAEQKKKEAMLQ